MNTWSSSEEQKAEAAGIGLVAVESVVLVVAAVVAHRAATRTTR